MAYTFLPLSLSLSLSLVYSGCIVISSFLFGSPPPSADLTYFGPTVVVNILVDIQNAWYVVGPHDKPKDHTSGTSQHVAGTIKLRGMKLNRKVFSPP